MVTGCENPLDVEQASCHGGLAWAGFGLAGFNVLGFLTPRTAATLIREKDELAVP